METLPVRNALGYGELFWSLRQWLTRQRSSQWAQVLGTVEGYELLMARQNGWFVLFYSYEFEGTQFSGECRKWMFFIFSSVESRTERITAQLPVGTKVGLRVDPNTPSRSIAEFRI
jgi:hypothetical protein